MMISGNFGHGGPQGINFGQMQQQFAQMKEQMASKNPEMAQKMEAFDSKLRGLVDSGMSMKDAVSQTASEMGLPDPTQMGMGGMPGMDMSMGIGRGFGMGGSNDETNQGAHQRTLNLYGMNGQSVQNSAIQGLLDILG